MKNLVRSTVETETARLDGRRRRKSLAPSTEPFGPGATLAEETALPTRDAPNRADRPVQPLFRPRSRIRCLRVRRPTPFVRRFFCSVPNSFGEKNLEDRSARRSVRRCRIEPLSSDALPIHHASARWSVPTDEAICTTKLRGPVLCGSSRTSTRVCRAIVFDCDKTGRTSTVESSSSDETASCPCRWSGRTG